MLTSPDCGELTTYPVDRQTFIPIAKRNVLPAGDCYHWVATSLRVNGKEIALESQKEGPTP